MDKLLTIENFQGQEQTAFTAQTEQGDSVDFILTEVEARPVRTPDPKREPFSLIFCGPKNAQFKQATVELTHPSFDQPQRIFMVALGFSKEIEGCLEYQAIFS
ncbi:MAG: hypothetical protein CMH98_13520 [Oceanospirillaceae bacterium]|nr:hypothetical protein [Oceanospirillaceae bacterium]